MSDTPGFLDGMPDGIPSSRPSKTEISLRDALKTLATRDADLAKRLTGDLKSIERERKDLRERFNRQLERESKILARSGLAVEEQAAVLERLQKAMVAEDKRIGQRLDKVQKNTLKGLKGYDKILIERLVKEDAERKKYLEDIKGDLSEALGTAFKETTTKTLDTFLGPLKLITRPLEELTGTSLIDLLGKRIDRRRELKERQRDRLLEESESIRGSGSSSLGDLLDHGKSPRSNKKLSLPENVPSALLPSAGITAAALDKKTESLIDLLAPGGGAKPQRAQLIKQGVIGRSAVYLGDLMGGDGAEAKKTAGQGNTAVDTAIGDLSAKAIEKLLTKVGPALLGFLATPAAAALIAAAAGTAALGLTINERSKRDKTTSAMFSALPAAEQQSLQAAGLDRVQEAVSLSKSAPGTPQEKAKIAKQLLTLGSQDLYGGSTAAAAGMAYDALGLFTPGNRHLSTGLFGMGPPMITTPQFPEGVNFWNLTDDQRQKIIKSFSSPLNSFVPSSPNLSQDALNREAYKFWIDKVSKMPAFARGGIVPGPMGQPTLVRAEGGETFVPSHDRTFRENLDMMLTPDAVGDRDAARAISSNEVIHVDDSVNDGVIAAIERLIAAVNSSSRSAAPVPSVLPTDFNAYRRRGR